jgi:AcrR family transcriptional regulator
VTRRRLSAPSRRETILQAAVPLFASAGYELTRVSDIAARVGVTEPVIFQNFGTKADLFAAVLERAATDAVGHLSQLAERSATVHEWLRTLLSSDHLDHLHTAPMFGALLRDAHLHQTDASVAVAMHHTLQRAADTIAAILERGQSDGTIRVDASALTLAWLVLSLIQAREFRRSVTLAPSATLEQDLLTRALEAFRPQP